MRPFIELRHSIAAPAGASAPRRGFRVGGESRARDRDRGEAPDGEARAHEASRVAWRVAPRAAVLLGILAMAAVFGYAYLFTTFRLNDDQGYFLLALRAYHGGAALYDQIATIYGPFYFEITDGVFRLFHAAYDDDAARYYNLAIWILSALAVSRYVERVTHNLAASALACFLACFLMRDLGGCPLHPDALIVLLTALCALASVGLADPATEKRALLACGALTAALSLTKLNAGAFAVLAFATYFVRFSARSRTIVWRSIASAVLLALFPFALMARELGDPRIRELAVTIAFALVPLALLPLLDRGERSSPRIRWYLAGAFALTFAVLSVCWLRGTSSSGLWGTLIVGTIRFPGSFVIPPQYAWGAEILVAAAAVPIFFLRSRTSDGLRALVKLAGGLTVLALCISSTLECFRALPLVWLVALPSNGARRSLDTRALLALLVVLESAHSYPIAAAQAIPFACLMPAVGAITVCDAWHDLPERWRSLASRTRWRWLGAVGTVGVLASFHSLRTTAPILVKQFEKSVPLELPGAESLRLYERRAAECQWVAANLRQNGDTFLAIPGLHSFYNWSSLVPPLAFYPNTWVIFYDDAREEDLVRALSASDHPCVLRDRAMIEFWTGKRDLRDGPVARLVRSSFRSAGIAGDYEILLPNSARADLVLSVSSEPAPSALRDRFAIDRAWRLSFPDLPGTRIARVVVRDTQRNRDLFDSDAPRPSDRVRLVNERGDDLLCDGARTIDLSSRSHVFMLGPTPSFALDAESALVRAYDEKGTVVARLLVPKRAGD
jgi:hypothetical protein